MHLIKITLSLDKAIDICKYFLSYDQSKALLQDGYYTTHKL